MNDSRPDAAAAEPRGKSLVATRSSACGESRSRRTVTEVLKDIALLFAAPFVTLAYLPLFPFIGLAILGQAWRHRKEAG
jgi:hypothetical protein